MSAKISKEEFEFLRSIDTPTVCNLVEIVTPARRGAGYTVRHLHCPFPDLPTRVARVASRAADASDADAAVARVQEEYDLGNFDDAWTMVDASGTPEETLARTKAALR